MVRVKAFPETMLEKSREERERMKGGKLKKEDKWNRLHLRKTVDPRERIKDVARK